jgi:hypothetical protein
LVGERGQIDGQPGVHGLQHGQARGQVATQPELVGHPHPRFQHGDAAGGAVAQRALVLGRHDDPRSPAHPGRGRGDQRGIARVVAGDDQHIKRPDPGRRLGDERDRCGGRGAQRRGQHDARRLGGAAARHPNHRAWGLSPAHRIEFALLEGGRDRPHLGARVRRGPQEAAPVRGEQAFGVLEIDRLSGVHGIAFSAAAWAAI